MPRSYTRKRSPCKSNQMRNPKTSRCVKKSGPIGRKLRGLSPCKKGKTRSRVTGRCHSPCKSNQRRNPATRRCVKKSGSIGKSLSRGFSAKAKSEPTLFSSPLLPFTKVEIPPMVDPVLASMPISQLNL